MNEGMLWLDTNTPPQGIEERIGTAVRYFEQKYRRPVELVELPTADAATLGKTLVLIDGALRTVSPSPQLMRHHVLVG